MPVKDKINNILHRKSSVPEAPTAPAAPLTQSVLPVDPITGSTLLQQKQALHETTTSTTSTNYDQTALASGDVFREDRSLAPIISQDTFVRREQEFNQNTYTSSNTSTLLLRQEPTIIERIEKDIVIQERIHPIEKEEFQPVIYREREQTDVKQITQMLHETQVQPTLIEQRELPAEIREAVIERAAPMPTNIVLPTREVDATVTTREVRAPIIEEVIKKTVIEEVQPVIERDIIAPTVIQQTKTIYEKIIEAPTVTREVREFRELGTRGAVLGNETVYLGHNQALSHNLLDRNNDGKVDFKDFAPNAGLGQQYGTQYSSVQYNPSSQYNASGLTQTDLLSKEQGALGTSSYEQRMMEEQLIRDQQLLQQQQKLPTGQVLPTLSSSRPAYAYLPAGYAERKPDFVGTSSQYVLQAKNVPLNHNRGLHTQNTYPQVAPQNVLRQ